METARQRQKRRRPSLSSWGASGFAVGFTSGYVSIGSWIAGLLLGIGMALALGMAGRSQARNVNC